MFRTDTGLPVELRALHGRVEPVFLRYAATRAEALGIGADAVVARSGVIHPDAMMEAYAADLGIDVDRLDDTAVLALDAEAILSSGHLPAGIRSGKERPTLALRGANLKTLYERTQRDPAYARSVMVTSSERLRDFVQRAGAAKLADDAAFGLQQTAPQYSAGMGRFNGYIFGFLAAACLATLSYWFAFRAVFFAIEVALALTFLTWGTLRFYACVIGEQKAANLRLSEKDLPVYTVLIPLHRESRVIAGLVEAISALNYPREKLDVKLILEPDDKATLAAVRAIQLDPCFEIVIAPDRGPRTKPKALRAALPFARGEFAVVYDAEDRPHPDQLRDAYAAFLAGDEKLACVQAKLAIDNASSGFLTGHFRAEYSGLFDVLLPALVHLQLPVPLGGTSNHFRVDALRRVGGWDPHNVTEDADLGIRLARFGYTTGMVDSSTWEEAPVRLGAWLMQRTRWMKGWLQTYVVHMRNPFLLYRQLRARGFFAFQLLIGGTVLAALVHPVFVVWLLLDSTFGSLLAPAASPAAWAQKALVFGTLTSGYLASGLLAFVGLRRRGLLSSAWILLTIPLYWLLLSAAAWRAVWKLLWAPYQWEKTEHGIARRKARPG